MRARAAIAPSHRANVCRGSAVVEPAADDVVALRQRGDSTNADLVAGPAADQRIGVVEFAGGSARAIAPGDSAGVRGRSIGPRGADGHVVAIAQRRNAAVADVVVRMRPDL